MRGPAPPHQAPTAPGHGDSVLSLTLGTWGQHGQHHGQQQPHSKHRTGGGTRGRADLADSIAASSVASSAPWESTPSPDGALLTPSGTAQPRQ